MQWTRIKMLSTTILAALIIVAIANPVPEVERLSKRSSPGGGGGSGGPPPGIPTLDDLKNGKGNDDPLANGGAFVIEMRKGKIAADTQMKLAAFIEKENSKNGDFSENKEETILEDMVAYQDLLEAIQVGDEYGIRLAMEKARHYMADTNTSLEDAREEARSVAKGRQSTSNKGGRSRRYLANSSDYYKWSKCIIPYQWGEGYTGQEYVRTTMKIYEAYTGFRFVEYNDSVSELYGIGHENRLNFISGGGCWSYVGNYRSWGGQDISCCSGTACVHEIGHAIGFMHEQSNPLREDYLRIQWSGISSGGKSQYYRSNLANAVTYGYYDPTSVMHYWNGGFSINYKLTFYTLDPDRDFLINRDYKFYYFKEAQEFTGCLDEFCPGAKPVCENGGFASVIGGVCKCACPEGLDTKTNCATPEYTDKTLSSLQWPQGQFSTLKTISGCPEGFEDGHWYHVPPDYVWGSNPYHANPDWSWWSATHEFCTKTDATAGDNSIEWPKGSYCILRKGGSCPADFDTGYIQMDDKPTTVSNQSSGVLPDGEFGNNTRFEFCCRDDGSDSTQVRLPTAKPFILFKKGGCQNVAGMSSISEYFAWRNDGADNIASEGGSLPTMYRYNNALYNVYFCYYQAIDQDCSAIYELGSGKSELVITSPNYPATYPSSLKCTYTIKAPEGTKLQIDVTDFNVPCGTDSLEISLSMPGQRGNDFCGNGFDETIVTSENFARLILRSSYTQQGEYKFSATVKLVEEQCYTNGDKDGSYDGRMNFTKRNEPCLPWNDVQHCRFHRFAQETFDDDLTDNYCRNTGVGTDPWCYTNDETCYRDYCDACATSRCYDLFSDCDSLISDDNTYCSSNVDGQAHRGCRESCGLCPSQAALASQVTCPVPENIDSIAPVNNNNASTFNVGDQVEYVCSLDGARRTRTCTSSGQWTHLGYVCGACPNGWGYVDGRCYKWYDGTWTRDEGLAFCQQQMANSTLPDVLTPRQGTYIQKIAGVDKQETSNIWLGLNEKVAEGTFVWTDGSSPEYTNWDEGEPDGWGDCVLMMSSTKWRSFSCSYHRSLVCMFRPEARRTCADQIRNCEANIRANPDLCVRQPDYAEANCPRSCGICTDSEPGRRKRAVTDDCGGVIFTTSAPTTTTTEAPTTTTAAPTTTTAAPTTTTAAPTTTNGPMKVACSYPGVPSNAIQAYPNTSADIVPGQFYEYRCMDGFALASGDLQRACLLSSMELTGESPTCSASSLVEEPVNSDSIRPRRSFGSSGHTYSAVNSDFRITKAGNLTKWRFYSSYNGKIALQVWRDLNGTYGVFVGQNIIQNTGDDRIRTIQIAADQQISVQVNDSIALHYPKEGKAGIPFTRCESEYEPSEGRQVMSTDSRAPSDFVTGTSYGFRLEGSSWVCKTWSLNAWIR